MYPLGYEATLVCVTEDKYDVGSREISLPSVSEMMDLEERVTEFSL